MGSASLLFTFFGCIVGLVILGIVLSIFASLFGFARRRRWGYGGYYERPRPLFPWFFFRDPYPRRERFFEPGPREFHRRESFEHHHHHQPPHHHGGGFGGGHHGGGFGGGGHHGGHH